MHSLQCPLQTARPNQQAIIRGLLNVRDPLEECMHLLKAQAAALRTERDGQPCAKSAAPVQRSMLFESYS